ncbi:response regulator transcription factor [Erythrobacter sp. SCSIO 43205]|uniref:response regulator n=1 Tax=Erythrobacter sp. SCSIO 43205 TaxID=2779361 RepID=UPI001CA9C18B|nr:response regulator transcription factor [Erythrobacter sp. SCSIO 43205]UAB77644.1 response regulator transcription factor [Erythrobacter sp. SCSIO 43205]
MSSPSTTPTILIVDDHQLAREGLRAVLSGDGFGDIHLASTGEQAIEMVREIEPDIVLMDVRLGEGIDGLEATRQIAALGLSTKVIMLTLHDMPGYVRTALSAGAAGYVLKDTEIGDLRAAIAQVLDGRSAIPLDLVSAAMKSDPVSSATGDLGKILTEREQEVVEHVAQGLTNKEIARKLEISPATVKVHVERLIAKLGVADRTQAAVVATQLKSAGSSGV